MCADIEAAVTMLKDQQVESTERDRYIWKLIYRRLSPDEILRCPVPLTPILQRLCQFASLPPTYYGFVHGL